MKASLVSLCVFALILLFGSCNLNQSSAVDQDGDLEESTLEVLLLESPQGNIEVANAKTVSEPSALLGVVAVALLGIKAKRA